MRVVQLVAGLLTMAFGQSQQVDAPQEDGHGRYYSGAEWVLDADGAVIASSAVVVERILDVPNRVLVQHVIRESPRRGLLPRESTTKVTLVATSASPHALDGLALRDGTRVEIVERVSQRVLVISETVRGSDGRAVEVHVVDATPLAREEYEPWARRLRTL